MSADHIGPGQSSADRGCRREDGRGVEPVAAIVGFAQALALHHGCPWRHRSRGCAVRGRARGRSKPQLGTTRFELSADATGAERERQWKCSASNMSADSCTELTLHGMSGGRVRLCVTYPTDLVGIEPMIEISEHRPGLSARLVGEAGPRGRRYPGLRQPARYAARRNVYRVLPARRRAGGRHSGRIRRFHGVDREAQRAVSGRRRWSTSRTTGWAAN